MSDQTKPDTAQHGRLELGFKWEFDFGVELPQETIDQYLREIAQIVTLTAHRAVNVWGDDKGISTRRIAGKSEAVSRRNGDEISRETHTD